MSERSSESHEGRLAPGERVLDRFVVEELLRHGDASETYRALDSERGDAVSLRVAFLRGSPGWKRIELLEREAAVLGSLSHEAIPKLRASGREQHGDDLRFALARDFVTGETLFERVARAPLEPREAAKIGEWICDALGYLHGRTPPIIHRDVKPRNIVLKPAGGIALIDFGSVAEPGRAEGGSTIAGTFGYIAPEQVVGEAGPEADLYSLGATLLAALTGREPTQLPREGLRIAVKPLVTHAVFARVLEELVEPDPRARPRSAAVVASKLRALAAVLPQESAAQTPQGSSTSTRTAQPDAELGRDATPALPDDELDRRWEGVLLRWSDTDAHDRFVAACAEQHQLPFAGNCYREYLVAHPSDPQAARAKKRIMAQALAMLEVETKSRRDWREFSKTVRAATLIVILGAMGVAIFLMFRMVGGR